jgi:hypothetical protein
MLDRTPRRTAASEVDRKRGSWLAQGFRGFRKGQIPATVRRSVPCARPTVHTLSCPPCAGSRERGTTVKQRLPVRRNGIEARGGRVVFHASSTSWRFSFREVDDESDGRGEPFPVGGFGAQVRAPLRGEAIILGFTASVGLLPVGSEGALIPGDAAPDRATLVAPTVRRARSAGCAARSRSREWGRAR